MSEEVPKNEEVKQEDQSVATSEKSVNAADSVSQSSIEANAGSGEASPEDAAAASVETDQESVGELSAEERGQEIMANASKRVRGFFSQLSAGGTRLMNTLKGWGGKALKFTGKFAAIAVGGSAQAIEFAGDKVSEGYNAAIERYNTGKEALKNRAEAAKAKLEGAINTAKAKFQERITPIKERFQAYMKAREELAQSKAKFRQARMALLATPL